MVEPRTSIIDEKNVKPYISPQQKKQRRLTIIIVLVVVGIGAGAWYLLAPKDETYSLSRWEQAVVTSGSFEKTTQASGSISIPSQMEVRSPEAGYAKTLSVAEGDAVRAGDLLAVIGVPDLEEDLSELRDDYETDLLNLEKSSAQSAISMARTKREIASIEESIAEAVADVERVRKLVAVDSAKQSDLASAESQLEQLEEQLAEAIIGLDDDLRLLAIDTKIQEANLERSRREIRKLEERIASARIRSPMNGEVIEIVRAIGVPGTAISANQSIFVVADPASAVADLELLEQYAADVVAGDEVLLTISNTRMTGIVETVGRVAQASTDGLGATVAIRVRPVDPPISLLSGATAVGTFLLGVAENSLILPRGPYLTTGSQRYVYVVDGEFARRRQVTFGQIEGNSIEVVRGLEAGEKIITSGYQNYIEYETVRLTKGE